MNFEPMYPGFESRKSHDIFIFLFFLFFLFLFSFFFSFLSSLLQCKFANSTLLSVLSFSYFITPYDAQASSVFSILIVLNMIVIAFLFPDRDWTNLKLALKKHTVQLQWFEH